MSPLFARAAVATALALGVAGGALVLLAPAASAADLPATVVSTSTVGMDETFDVSGSGCIDTAGRPGNVDLRGPRFVLVTWVGEDGNWSTFVSMNPPGGGTYTIAVTCLLAGTSLSYPPITMTVVGPPPPPPQPPNWWEPGGSGRPPGQPTGPPAKPPAAPAAPPAAQPASPRTTAPTGSPAPDPTVTPPTTPPPAPTSGRSAVAPTPAAGCSDCERLTGEEPLTAGEELTLSYAGFQPGEQVTVVMRSTPVELGTFTADASGTVTANVTIPASAETGSHTLTLSGPVTGDQVLRFRLWAQRDDVAEPASEGTGLTMPLALGGAGLVLLAVGGLVLYRRRAARSAESDHPTQGQPTETPIREPIP